MRPSPALALFATLLATTVSAQRVTPPEEHLGRPVGVDFELADWNEVSSWFRLLGKQSPRVQVSKVGTTTEGRDFLLAVISSERNLARLPEIREQARRIADEILFVHKGRLIERGDADAFFDAPQSEEGRAFVAGELLW